MMKKKFIKKHIPSLFTVLPHLIILYLTLAYLSVFVQSISPELYTQFGNKYFGSTMFMKILITNIILCAGGFLFVIWGMKKGKGSIYAINGLLISAEIFLLYSIAIRHSLIVTRLLSKIITNQ